MDTWGRLLFFLGGGVGGTVKLRKLILHATIV